MTDIHVVPGRLRVRSGALKRDPGCGGPLKSMLESVPGVRSVEIRPATGSIIVCYSAGLLKQECLLATLDEWGFLSAPAAGRRPAIGGRVSQSARAATPLVVNRAIAIVLEKLVERSVANLIAGLL